MQGAAGVVHAAVRTGETVDMSAFDDITIFTTDGASVKFADLWDQKNVSLCNFIDISYRVEVPSHNIILRSIVCG